MFDKTPRIFDTVVSRDSWLWDNMEVPLLSESDMDRLVELHQIPQPDYTFKIAQELEREQRWLEAQSYWFARASILAPSNGSKKNAFKQAIVGIIRTGAQFGEEAPPDGFREELESFLESALLHSSTSVRGNIIRSLLLAMIVPGSVFDETELSSTARIAFAQAVSELYTQVRDNPPVKGARPQFDRILQVYTQEFNTLRNCSDTITLSPNFETIRNNKEKLFKTLSKISILLPSLEQEAVSKIQSLLNTSFRSYEKLLQDVEEDVYNAFRQHTEIVFNDLLDMNSHVTSCVLVPLLLGISAAVTTHYQSVVLSSSPILSIRLLKPEASRTSNGSVLDFEITNEGTRAAEQCDMHLVVPQDFDLVLDPEDIFVGRVEANQRSVVQCKMQYSSKHDRFEIPYRIEWKDRRATQELTDIIKVTLQQEIDWLSFNSMPTPYNIQSVTNPNKLKGRSEQLRTLHFGFQGNSSFMITGQKRVGKTSLVKVFLAEIEKLPNVLSLYIPIGELSAAAGASDIGRVGRDLVDRIVEEFESKFDKPININIPSIDDFRDSFNAVFTRFVRQFIKKHPLRLALALDDFDELPVPLFTGDTGKAFFLALRALIDGGTSFFFIGSERLPAIMREQAERLNQVKPLAVDYLDREAIAALVREPVKGYLEFTDESIEKIETWSARNPYFATLICIAIWERALKTQDYWVVGRDVDFAINDLAEGSESNSYQHFWSDSPLSADEQRDIYATKSSYVLMSLIKHQPSPLTFTERQRVVASCDGLNTNEAEQHLQELINRNVIANHRDHTSLIRVRVPLFCLWLKNRGAAELYQLQQSKGRLNSARSKKDEISAHEAYEVSQGLSYRGREIGTDEVRVWLEQFGVIENQRLMLKLLRKLRDTGLYPLDKFMFALEALHKLVRQEANGRKFTLNIDARNKNRIRNCFVTHADETGKSGSEVVKQYRSQNNVYVDNCGDPSKVISAMAKGDWDSSVLVCVNDFVGTGHSAANDLKQNVIELLDKNIPLWQEKVLLIYAVVVGFEDGLNYIRDQVGHDIPIICTHTLTTADKAFSEENNTFATAEERIRARDLVNRIGLAIERRAPLGYEGSEALIVFPDNVPNNSLPILFKESAKYDGKPWKPLFPRS